MRYQLAPGVSAPLPPPHADPPPFPGHRVFFCPNNRDLGVSVGTSTDWNRLFRKGRNVNVLSAARFFLFGSRDVWFEIGLPLFLRVELGWKRELVGLILAGMVFMCSVHTLLSVSPTTYCPVRSGIGVSVGGRV